MANVINVVGDSGSGKTTSLRTLDPKSTFIINTLNKPLPFPGSAKMYTKENKNIGVTTNADVICQTLKNISDNAPNVKKCIVDDAAYIMNVELFERAREKGYDKFTLIAENMYKVLNTAKSLRDDLDVVFMWHLDEQLIDGMTLKRTVKLPGRMLEERFNPLHLSTVTVFTHVEFHKDKDEEYFFVVNKTPEYSLAKSPMGMFEEKMIPNDMANLLKVVRDYYESDENT
jgi:uridine kinase